MHLVHLIFHRNRFMPVVYAKCYLMWNIRAHTLGLPAVIIIGELAAALVALTNITIYLLSYYIILTFNNIHISNYNIIRPVTAMTVVMSYLPLVVTVAVSTRHSWICTLKLVSARHASDGFERVTETFPPAKVRRRE